MRQPYRLHCGLPALADELGAGLEGYGWESQALAKLTLLIDNPSGLALQLLEGGCPSHTVVVTDSPCPEYWEELWSLRPRALLAGGHRIPEVADALDRAQAGGHFRHVPHHASPLTEAERKLLRHGAVGWDNKRIAHACKLTEGTVKNGLNRVFQKLGLKNRTELALYYWGLWHLLEAHPSRRQTAQENESHAWR